MRFFIGYAFQGEQKTMIDELREDISSKFFVKAALQCPPHLTLFYPFETTDIQKLEVELRSFARDRSPIDLAVTGFNSFGSSVWFLDVEQKTELQSLKESVVRIVKRTLNIEDPRKDQDTHFHITLAYKDVSDDVFLKIGEYLSRKPLPIARFSCDALTIFEYFEERWLSIAEISLQGKRQ